MQFHFLFKRLFNRMFNNNAHWIAMLIDFLFCTFLCCLFSFRLSSW